MLETVYICCRTGGDSNGIEAYLNVYVVSLDKGGITISLSSLQVRLVVYLNFTT